MIGAGGLMTGAADADPPSSIRKATILARTIMEGFRPPRPNRLKTLTSRQAQVHAAATGARKTRGRCGLGDNPFKQLHFA
jgi:hypothetical protein